MATWLGMGISPFPIVNNKPSAKRTNLTHLVIRVEHGKPVTLLSFFFLGKQTVRRADGVAGKGGWKSECHSVMGVPPGWNQQLNDEVQFDQ
jgi:hypothetical protein